MVFLIFRVQRLVERRGFGVFADRFEDSCSDLVNGLAADVQVVGVEDQAAAVRDES